MTPPAVRRSSGPLLLATALLTTVLLTAGCSTSISGSADPARSSAAGSAVSPVLPSDAPQTDEPPTDEPPTTAATTTSTPAPDLPTVGTRAPPTGPVTDPVTTDPVVPDPTTTNPTGTQLTRFRSPTGNISCLLDSGDADQYVRCDLSESDITEEHDCGGTGAWGRSVTLEAGSPAEMTCVSDTVADADLPILAYGETTTVNAITCRSEETGVVCLDDVGHGFRLSRSGYEVA